MTEYIFDVIHQIYIFDVLHQIYIFDVYIFDVLI